MTQKSAVRPIPGESSPLAWLVPLLPPIIARKEVRKILGGVVAPNTLCNDDRRGLGPAKRFKFSGGDVAYRREDLVDYLERKGVSVIEIPKL